LGGGDVDATPANRRRVLHKRRNGETQFSVVSVPESWGVGDRYLEGHSTRLAPVWAPKDPFPAGLVKADLPLTRGTFH
jgi:hypothetical protein